LFEVSLSSAQDKVQSPFQYLNAASQKLTTLRPQGTNNTIMAATISHMQHISALSIISPNTQLSRISPSGKQVRFVPLTRITSSSTIRSKHKPRYILTMEEERYHALLASEPIAVFPEGEGIRSDASNPTQTPNASLRRALITRISPATTPPVSSE
jgi:hypothetical protein